jgi:transposase InsO family protein
VTQSSSKQEKWARFRFQIVGALLADPPPEGALRDALEELSRRSWIHPIRPDEHKSVGFSTIERWFYAAKGAEDPIEVLRRSVRKDAGMWRVFSDAVIEVIRSQYREYPGWTYQLHHDNLAVLVEEQPSLGQLPSYPTLVRFMKARNMRRQKRRGNVRRPGLVVAQDRLESRETRSFEVEYVGALWHFDFHHSKHVSIVEPNGQRLWPILFGVLDDHSRLCCHAQFYLEETTDCLVHGYSQGLLKRGRPRGSMSDRGAAMLAGEFTQGLERLSITHETTLPYSPQQNGKQEHFWAVVEERFLAMLDRIEDLTLASLNEFLQAWVEIGYNRHFHSEIRQSPLERYLTAKNVTRSAPSPQRIREVFRLHEQRKIRRSDLTVSIEGRRFEIPAAYRHLASVRVAYARFDLSHVHLVDPRTGDLLPRIFPVDRTRNASGQRRFIDSSIDPLAPLPPKTTTEIPPLLRRCVAEYAASGLPPAFLHKADPPNDQGEAK